MTAAGDSPPPHGPVFVAGSSGRTGRRIVRELANSGVEVRAGCRSVARAREAVGKLDAAAAALVSYVDFDVGDQDGYAAAISDAQVVVSALGSTEGLNLLSFAQVDGLGVARLMKFAAQMRAVKQLVIVSSIGVGRPFGFPAALLNLFGGVLLWKGYSERVMRRAVAGAGSSSYFIVRPGGMERAQDDFMETRNAVLKPRGSLSGGVISRLQVAKIVCAAILHPDAARNKTVEAVAEATAPKVDIVDLLHGVHTS